jgi:hypothetical protein
MPPHAVRSRSNKILWQACTTRFLTETGTHTGPTGYPSHPWLTHRLHRDRLYAAAAVPFSPTSLMGKLLL